MGVSVGKGVGCTMEIDPTALGCVAGREVGVDTAEGNAAIGVLRFGSAVGAALACAQAVTSKAAITAPMSAERSSDMALIHPSLATTDR